MDSNDPLAFLDEPSDLPTTFDELLTNLNAEIQVDTALEFDRNDSDCENEENIIKKVPSTVSPIQEDSLEEIDLPPVVETNDDIVCIANVDSEDSDDDNRKFHVSKKPRSHVKRPGWDKSGPREILFNEPIRSCLKDHQIDGIRKFFFSF